jgi:hypothetical protein
MADAASELFFHWATSILCLRADLVMRIFPWSLSTSWLLFGRMEIRWPQSKALTKWCDEVMVGTQKGTADFPFGGTGQMDIRKKEEEEEEKERYRHIYEISLYRTTYPPT